MKKLKYVIMGFLIGALFLLTGCGKTTINVSEYVDVKFEGLDGKGTATVTTNGLEGAIERVVYDKNGAGSMEGVGIVIDLMDSVKLDLDNTTELKNGDTVTVTISVNEELADDNNIEFQGLSPISFDVSGLKEAIMLDPFDPSYFNTDDKNGITINFTGVSPKAEVNIDNNFSEDDPKSKIVYRAEPHTEIAKGQEIVITATAGYELEEMGYALSSEEAKIVCDNVDTYLNDLSVLTDTQWSDLMKDGEELAKQRDEEKNGLPLMDKEGSLDLETGHFSNLKFTKAYLLTANEDLDYFDTEELGDYWGSPKMRNGGLILSFSCDVASKKNVCGCCFAADVVVKTDGTLGFDSYGYKVNNILYENEEELKKNFIDIHSEHYSVSEKPLQ